MKINLFAKTILLLLSLVLAGCSAEERTENTVFDPVKIVRKVIANTSQHEIANGDLPVWLSEFIDGLGSLDDMREVAAIKGNWKGEDVYYVYDYYSSCLACSTFNSEGEKIDWSKIDFENFWESATGWKCIYLHKSNIHSIFDDI
ncbi:hypothetical protein E5358_03595 [Palleniella muris]|uniref:Uncharacterized protein n=1 Tax=Palleniella muris TaxID=3038145 RepID=A0AC61QSB0_9BACT|nr:hypothetical protein [Palleniella muris]TGX83348.1 hypothetical protein E5358_03595 [Palleniella muris]